MPVAHLPSVERREKVGLRDLIARASASPADQYERLPSARWRVIEGRVVLIDANEGQLLHLNEVGSRVWELLDGKKSVDQIIGELDNAFDASPAHLRKDVRKFVRKLHRMELIRKLDSPHT